LFLLATREVSPENGERRMTEAMHTVSNDAKENKTKTMR